MNIWPSICHFKCFFLLFFFQSLSICASISSLAIVSTHVQCFKHVSIVYCAYQSWVHFLSLFIYIYISSHAIQSAMFFCNFNECGLIFFFCFQRTKRFFRLFFLRVTEKNRHSFSTWRCIIGKFHIIYRKYPGKRNEKKKKSLKNWMPAMVRCNANRTDVNRK